MFWATWTLLGLVHDVERMMSGGHSLEFENSVYVRLAEQVSVNNFDGNSVNSVTCHPSMHAPPLARVLDGSVMGLVGWSVERGLEEG